MKSDILLTQQSCEGVFSLEKKENPIPTEKERRLIELIRELGYGEVRIFVAEGQPVRAEEVKRSVKL